MWIKDIDASWTLFLDRDGVINQRNYQGYVTNVESFLFTNAFLENSALLSNIFAHVFIVTNQQGVGKGEMSLDKLQEIHNFMLTKIKEHGGKIDEVFSATNLKNAINDRRKPLVKMAIEAQLKFPDIDFNKSIMIGDTNSDILFGKNLGMKTILMKSLEIVTEKPDLVIADFNELINLFKA